MPEQTDFVAVADGLIAGTADAPELIGSRCRTCGAVTFPRQASCAACTSGDVEERRVGRHGTLWTWTIQCFAPRAPPYAGTAEDFEPYGVGYVELPGEVRVEALLTQADAAQLRIGMPMELVLVPAPGDGRLPVNTGGGYLANGEPIGASGCGRSTRSCCSCAAKPVSDRFRGAAASALPRPTAPPASAPAPCSAAETWQDCAPVSLLVRKVSASHARSRRTRHRRLPWDRPCDRRSAG